MNALTTRILSLTLTVSFPLCLSITARADGHIDPSGFTATASDSHATFYPPESVINGAGLDQGGTFPNQIHAGTQNNFNSVNEQWLTKEPSGDWWKVDLGTLYALESVIVWNGSFRGGTSGIGTMDSIQQADIYYSTKETDPGPNFSDPAWIPFGTPGTRILTANPGTNAFGPTETINLGVNARWFALAVNSSYGHTDWAALAELQFVGTVGAELIELKLVSIDPVNVELQWESTAGLSYNVLGSVGLPPDNPLPWTIYDKNGGILHNADNGTGDDDGDDSKTTVKVARPSEGDFYFAIASFPTPEQFAFEDDFDGADMGWAAGGTPGSGPTNWVEGTPGAPGPAAANSAPDCWGTNLTSDYGESADVTLTSPSIDLTGASTAELRFVEWANIDNPDIGGADVGSIEVLDADNADAFLDTIRTNTSNTTDWEPAAIDLTPHVGGNIKIRYRLVTDNDGFTGPGWYVDDVQVAFTP